jgi:hypothetical protein
MDSQQLGIELWRNPTFSGQGELIERKAIEIGPSKEADIILSSISQDTPFKIHVWYTYNPNEDEFLFLVDGQYFVKAFPVLEYSIQIDQHFYMYCYAGYISYSNEKDSYALNVLNVKSPLSIPLQLGLNKIGRNYQSELDEAAGISGHHVNINIGKCITIQDFSTFGLYLRKSCASISRSNPTLVLRLAPNKYLKLYILNKGTPFISSELQIKAKPNEIKQNQELLHMLEKVKDKHFDSSQTIITILEKDISLAKMPKQKLPSKGQDPKAKVSTPMATPYNIRDPHTPQPSKLNKAQSFDGKGADTVIAPVAFISMNKKAGKESQLTPSPVSPELSVKEEVKVEIDNPFDP